MKKYATSDLPRLVRHKKMWDPTVCLNFATGLLDWLKENVTVDDANVTYTVRYDSTKKQVTLMGPLYHERVFIRQK